MSQIVYAGYQFTYPSVWGDTPQPNVAGLYAVQVYDSNSSPQPYTLVYVGQSNDLGRRIAEHWNQDLSSWSSRGTATLYLSLLFAPVSTEDQRCAAETEIIEKYAPRFNQIVSQR